VAWQLISNGNCANKLTNLRASFTPASQPASQTATPNAPNSRQAEMLKWPSLKGKANGCNRKAEDEIKKKYIKNKKQTK